MSTPSQYDILIICALAEEANAVISEFQRVCRISFEKDFSSSGIEFQQTSIENNAGESLSIMVTWTPKAGGLNTALILKPLLDEYQPRFVGMTGICAGDRNKTSLGDIVVAERAFFYDTGKFETDDNRRTVHKHDADSFHPPSVYLQYIANFSSWIPLVAGLKRPISKQMQREWILNQLLSVQDNLFDNIPLPVREVNAPLWRQILLEMKSAKDRWLDDRRKLVDPKRVEDLQFDHPFPYTDPKECKVHVKPIASGNAVRADNPFRDVRMPVRDTIAIEMEGAAFYQVMHGYPTTKCLLVKSVCDYADADKDDTYHEYAAKASALYMLAFIKEYVNARLIPINNQSTNLQQMGTIPGVNIAGTVNVGNVSGNAKVAGTIIENLNIGGFGSSSPVRSAGAGTNAIRNQLILRLSRLPGPMFNQLVFVVNPAPGMVAGDGPQRTRAIQLCDWADSETGIGLTGLEKELDAIIGS